MNDESKLEPGLVELTRLAASGGTIVRVVNGARKLENTSPETSRQFVDFCAAAGMTLPLRAGDDIEIIVDARGRVVVQLDPDGTMSDEAVKRMRRALLIAVNACGGFKARRA